MSLESRLRALEMKVSRLESKLRKSTRPHRWQDKSETLIRKDPANIKASDLKEGEGVNVKNDTDGTRHIVKRIDNAIVSEELT